MRGENLSILIIGIFLLSLGFAIRYLIGKRRFKRRTIGGMQAYKSFNAALIITAIEGLLMILSIFMIFGGLVLVFLNYLNLGKFLLIK